MNILINSSNLKAGGGLQVADSICRELARFDQHKFFVVLSSYCIKTRDAISWMKNVTVYEYDIQGCVSLYLSGRDGFLDALVENYNIDAVLTIFGPSMWIPKVPHLCGFARAQMVIKESPFYTRMSKVTLLHQRIRYLFREIAFKKCADYFYTENPFITNRLEKKWRGKTIFTVTNYYNQIFDYPDQWIKKFLPSFDGITLLTIATPYAHKNLQIAAAVAKLLRVQHPDFRLRFVFSCNRDEIEIDINGVEDCFEFVGRVDIAECPSLYQQCDIVFQPTLMECFTAAYPEAMRMERPIVTTDLEFARSLCGEAAVYYSPIDIQACADAIYKVSTDIKLRNTLVEKGKSQIKLFDNYEQRANKLIRLIERITIV